jgi:hypothetical protein
VSLTAEEREYYEKQSVEETRRLDLEFEREFWSGLMGYYIEQGKSIASAAQLADEALACYRERFQ